MNKTLQIKDLKNSLKKIKEKKALIIKNNKASNKIFAKIILIFIYILLNH